MRESFCPLKMTLLLAAATLAFTACDKKPADPPSPGVPVTSQAAPPAPGTASQKAAEPSSFDEVAARLDAGGAFYFYLSTQQWLAGLSQQIASWRDVALSANPNQTPKDRETGGRVFNIVTNLVKKSGLEEISGVGASSFVLEPGVHRNKFFIHHYKGKGEGFIWSIFGKAPHPLTALDLLPADTALAAFGDFELAQLIGIIRQEVEQSEIPEAKQAMHQILAQISAVAGMPVDELLQSLGSSIGVVLTLDSTRQVTLPIEGRKETIPAPRLALLLEVKNDRIFKQIDATLSKNKEMPIVRVDEADLRMRTLPVPALPELQIRATAAQWGNYLVLASDDRLVRDFAATKKAGNGLKASPEFAKLAAGLPTEGNGFQLVTQRLADTWNRFQTEMVKTQGGADPTQMALIEKLLAFQKTGPNYAVSAHVENGWFTVGKGSTGAGQMIAPLMIAPVAVMAGVAMPVFSKAQEKAKATKSINQMKQIAIACRLYAGDNNGKFPPSLEVLVPDYLPDAKTFVSPFAPEVPVGYEYHAGLTDASPPDAVLIEDKFGAREKQRLVGHVDGSVHSKPPE